MHGIVGSGTGWTGFWLGSTRFLGSHAVAGFWRGSEWLPGKSSSIRGCCLGLPPELYPSILCSLSLVARHR